MVRGVGRVRCRTFRADHAGAGDGIRVKPSRARPLAPDETINVPLPRSVPTDAIVVAPTVTLTESPGAGFFTVFPAGTARLLASTINADGRGQTRAAGAIVAVSPTGLDVYSHAGGHVIVDVTGWFTGPGEAIDEDGLFVAAEAPRRLLDTRAGDPVWAGGVDRYVPDTSRIELSYYGLSERDLEEMPATLFLSQVPAHIENGLEAINYLKSLYTGKISYEFAHVIDEQERDWIQSKIENGEVSAQLSADDKKELFDKLTKIEGFEKYIHRTFVGAKRFSIEGLDTLVVLLDETCSSFRRS